jgi:cell division septation protein DedD
VPKNEDGEFELVLANRQLLSVFFIVVILLGVFFTMGYIVGRNSAPLLSDASASRTDTRPPAVDGSPRPTDAAPVETPPPQKETADTVPPEPPAPEPEKAEPEPAKAAPAKSETAKSTKAGKAAKQSASNRVIPGQMYLQLAATSQHEAEIMVDVLRKKGFTAITAEIDEKPGTFRVLVGPVTDTRSTNQMRSELQSAGFPGNAAIRRTF